MKSNTKLIVAVVVSSLAITSGGAAFAASKTTNVTKTTTKKIVTSNPKVDQKGGPMGGDRDKFDGPEKGGPDVLAAVLAKLVTAGTITQVQSDAIVKALVDDKAAQEAARDAFRITQDATRLAQQAKREAVITGALGISVAELKTQLSTGKSLAEIAGTKKDALIAALVADKSADIDLAVAAGKLTAAQATTVKANLVAYVTNEISSMRPKMDGHEGEKDGKGKEPKDNSRMGGKGKGPKDGSKDGPKDGPKADPKVAPSSTPSPAASAA